MYLNVFNRARKLEKNLKNDTILYVVTFEC